MNNLSNIFIEEPHMFPPRLKVDFACKINSIIEICNKYNQKLYCEQVMWFGRNIEFIIFTVIDIASNRSFFNLLEVDLNCRDLNKNDIATLIEVSIIISNKGAQELRGITGAGQIE